MGKTANRQHHSTIPPFIHLQPLLHIVSSRRFTQKLDAGQTETPGGATSRPDGDNRRLEASFAGRPPRGELETGEQRSSDSSSESRGLLVRRLPVVLVTAVAGFYLPVLLAAPVFLLRPPCELQRLPVLLCFSVSLAATAAKNGSSGSPFFSTTAAVNDGGVNVDNLDVNGDGEQNDNVDVGDEKDDDEKECENNDNQDQFQRKKRKRVSKAHADFSEVTSKDGSIKLQCIHCKTLLSKSSSATTSHLWNHLSRCIQKKLQTKNQKTLQFQNAKSKFETPPLSDGKYDHMKQREAIAHWILMHEQPLNVVENYGFTFMFKVNLPQFEKVSRAMAKNDVITVYDIEKKRPGSHGFFLLTNVAGFAAPQALAGGRRSERRRCRRLCCSSGFGCAVADLNNGRYRRLLWRTTTSANKGGALDVADYFFPASLYQRWSLRAPPNKLSAMP
nr:zinc finger BED domain-containing protein RICESLEEPER 2-like [Ipomoea batatas]